MRSGLFKACGFCDAASKAYFVAGAMIGTVNFLKQQNTALYLVSTVCFALALVLKQSVETPASSEDPGFNV